MKYLKQSCATIIATCFSLSLSAASIDKLDSFIEKSKQDLDLPYGTAVAIVKNNKVIYEGYFGYSDIENNKLVDEGTPFYIASSTKPFFALATLLKQAKGDISGNTSLKEMFPELNFKGIDANAITVKHLLSHGSGIDNAPLVLATAFSGIHDKSSRLKLIAESYPDVNHKLNEFSYSNVGYNVLSGWFESNYKEDWQKTLQQTVFSPLNLKRTSSYISHANTNGWNIARPYSVMNKESKQALYLNKVDSTMHAAGGMVSSVRDISRLLIAELNEGVVDGKQVFPAEVIKASQKTLISADKKYGEFKRSGYAWGWYTGEYKKQKTLHHFGGYAGTHAHISFMPEQNIGIVILNNEDMLSSKLTGIVADYAYSALLKEEGYEERIEQQVSKLKEMVSMLDKRKAQQAEKFASREWSLTLPAKNYRGKFSHPLLGDFNISGTKMHQFNVSWGNLHAVTTAYPSQDTMRVELVPNSGEIIKFKLVDGKIVSLQYSGVEFSKS